MASPKTVIEAIRARRALTRMRRYWVPVAQGAGVAGARLLRAENTGVGQVLTVELPRGTNRRALSAARLESAMDTWRGAIYLVNDPAVPWRVTVHYVAGDPWAGGSEAAHPLMTLVPALTAASTRTDLEEAV